MLRVWTIAMSTCVIMCVVGCSQVSVRHDYDRSYGFSSLKTYDWLPASVPVEVSELRIKRFRNVFDRHMKSRGYERSSDNPDFLIAMHITSRQVIEITDWGYSYASRYGVMRDIDVTQYTEGTAIIDFVDAQSKELFWRGIVTAVAEPSLTPEQQEAKFTEASEKLLEKFPPY